MISKICNWFGKIPVDKLLHFIVAYLILDIILSTGLRLNLNVILTIITAVVLTSLLIFGKESYDEKEYNGWNWKDILAGYIGVFAKLLVFLILIL